MGRRWKKKIEVSVWALRALGDRSGGWTGRRLEEAVSASKDLAHFRNVLWVLKVSFWSQEKNIAVSKDSISIEKDLTKDRNLNTFKMYCKRRKSSARSTDRKPRNRLCSCHCIAGNDQEDLTSSERRPVAKVLWDYLLGQLLKCLK